MLDQKPGYFWELQAWMLDNDVSGRELAVLTGAGKNVISRLICGQFVRVDERLKRKLGEATRGAIGDPEWAAFLQRRLEQRAHAA